MPHKPRVIPNDWYLASESIQKAMLEEILIGWGYEPVKPYYRQDANCIICADYGQTTHPAAKVYSCIGEPTASNMDEFRAQLDRYYQNVMCRSHLIEFYWDPALLQES